MSGERQRLHREYLYNSALSFIPVCGPTEPPVWLHGTGTMDNSAPSGHCRQLSIDHLAVGNLHQVNCYLGDCLLGPVSISRHKISQCLEDSRWMSISSPSLWNLAGVSAARPGGGGGYSLCEGYYICSSVSTPLFQVSGKFVEFRPLHFSKNEENVVFWPLYFSKNEENVVFRPLYFSKNEENVVFRPLFFIKIGQNV